MTKKDLKVGMVVEIENHHGKHLAMICNCGYCSECISSDNVYYPLEKVTDNLIYGRDTITKVYSVAYNTYDAYKLSTHSRNLLWERPEYYNGKVVCIKPEIGFTVGKIYEAKDGYLTDDDGEKRPNLPLPMKKLADYKSDKFIEVVE